MLNLNKKNNGALWKGETWKTIFERLVDREVYNRYKSWWIEKVIEYEGSLLDPTPVIKGYRLAAEDSHRVCYTKIPAEYNEYIQKTLKDEKYITELKEVA